jgi:hypothetical protein
MVGGVGRWGTALWVALAVAGCASTKEAAREAAPEAPSANRFIDGELGFTIERPSGEAWQFTPGGAAPEGIVVPVVVLHEDSGAQVVVQVAPAIASSEEFAGRLAMGLQSKPGFAIGDLRELDGGGTGFEFTLSDLVQGRVRVREAPGGRIFVLLGTWPAGVPAGVIRDIDGIMASLVTRPMGGAVPAAAP